MIETMLLLLLAYTVLGALFALVFLTVGIARVDPAAEHSGPAFKLAVAPGAALLWPVMLTKWWRA